MWLVACALQTLNSKIICDARVCDPSGQQTPLNTLRFNSSQTIRGGIQAAMAKAKEAKVAPKKAKTGDKSAKKSSSKTASSKATVDSLSEARIVDSDSEAEASTTKPETKSLQPVKEEKEKEKKTKRAKTKAAPAPPPPPPKEPTPSSDDDSSEEESGSDQSDEDEEMADAPAPRKPDTVPAKVNGVKRKAESVSSLDDGKSSEAESSSEDAKPDAKRAKTAPNGTGEIEQAGEVASDDDEEEEQEEDSESKDEDEDGGEEEEDDEQEPSADTAPAPRPAQHVNLESIPVQPFKPPNGYSSVDVTDVTFSAESFAGQQIWHIVAPKNVSLKSLSDVALDAITSGAPVLTYKGTEYSLSEDTSTSSQSFSVALPSKTSYNGISQPISRTLYIKQKVALPNLSKKQADVNTGSSAAADIAQPSVSDIRPQPKGMKMRYKPAGFGSGDPGLGSDSEEDGAQAKQSGSKFQFPKAIGAHGAAVEAEHAETSQAKKTKKKRKDSDVEMVNGDAAPASTVEGPTGADGARRSSKTESKGELSKEERKKLKAEKRARREAKAAAKVSVAA